MHYANGIICLSVPSTIHHKNLLRMSVWTVAGDHSSFLKPLNHLLDVLLLLIKIKTIAPCRGPGHNGKVFHFNLTLHFPSFLFSLSVTVAATGNWCQFITDVYCVGFLFYLPFKSDLQFPSRLFCVFQQVEASIWSVFHKGLIRRLEHRATLVSFLISKKVRVSH